MDLMQQGRGTEPSHPHPEEAPLWGPAVAGVSGLDGGLPAAAGWLRGVSLLQTPPVGSPAAEPACGPFPGPGPRWQMAVVSLAYRKAVDTDTHAKAFVDSKKPYTGHLSAQGAGMEG